MFRSATLLVLLTLAFTAGVAAAEEAAGDEASPSDERPCLPESRSAGPREADAADDVAPPVRFGIEVTVRGLPSGTATQASGTATADSTCRVDSNGGITCTSTG